MERLIELGVAIDTAIGAADEYDGGYNFERDRKIRDSLMALPTVDAVEVVRCRDCKHYQLADNRAFGFPVKRCEWTGFEDVDDEDFCSRGERKDGEQNG